MMLKRELWPLLFGMIRINCTITYFTQRPRTVIDTAATS